MFDAVKTKLAELAQSGTHLESPKAELLQTLYNKQSLGMKLDTENKQAQLLDNLKKK